MAPPPSTLSLIRDLCHPGPMPLRTRRTALIAIPVAAAVCVVLLLVGIVFNSDPGKQFGEGRPGTLISVILLVLSAIVAFKVARLAPSGLFRVFWIVFASLLVVAAADDMFKLHEKLDGLVNTAFHLDPDHHFFDRLDDIIVLAYVGVGVGVPALLVRRRLLSLRWSAWFFAFGAVFFVGMVITDTLKTSDGIEETLKVLAGACIFTGIAAAEHQLAPAQ